MMVCSCVYAYMCFLEYSITVSAVHVINLWGVLIKKSKKIEPVNMPLQIFQGHLRICV